VTENPTVPEPILEQFPLEELTPQTIMPLDNKIAGILKEVQGNLIIQQPVAVKEEGENVLINRPGELYRRYRTLDELPENAKEFYERAGKFKSPYTPKC
jgi:RNA polymerase I-specific transcription initiation factor RRN7